MWKNYLIIAARTLAKNRLFTMLNLVGLATGMAACLLIAMWVRNELTHDQWIPDHERVYAVQGTTQYPGRDPETWGGSPPVLLPLLQQDIPELESGTRMISTLRSIRLGERLESQPVTLVDTGFFDTIALPLVAGDVLTALKRPDQIAISESFARNWFGSTTALGQTLTVTVKGEKRPYTVVAVMRDLPSNTMLSFDVLMPLVGNDLANPQDLQNWGAFMSATFVKLKQATDIAQTSASLTQLMQKHNPAFLKVENGFYYLPKLMPIGERHLQRAAIKAGAPTGDRQLVLAVAITGLLILLIATVTYINLSTARVSLRAREVGLRKTLGASRRQLVAQFLVESTLLAVLAGVIALALVEVALPAFNKVLGLKLAFQYLGGHGVLIPLSAMVLAVGMLGGWYPALVLARLRPREAISGLQARGSGYALRRLLVIGQFGIAVLLMTCMAIIYAQVRYLQAVDMGYVREGLVVVSGINRAEVKPRQQSLIEAMRRVPGVVSVSRSMFDPTTSGISRQQAYLPGVPDEQAPQVVNQVVDWDYLKTYGGRVLAGRDLSEKIAQDDWPDLPAEEYFKRGGNALVNRAALKFFNTSDPREAIGKTFKIGSRNDAERITVTVVGVIEDIRLRSARDTIEPTFYARDPDHFTAMSIRFEGVSPAEITSRLEKAWKQLFSDTPYAQKFVDESVALYYQKETRRAWLFALFASIAIVLCAMGLYGLAVFTAVRRTKEIGIRKVLGASTAAIMRLLIWQFSKPVVIAIAIAWPIAWWLMRDWLNSFDARISLTPLPFLVSGLLAITIAWVTVAWHAARVATASPIAALRQE